MKRLRRAREIEIGHLAEEAGGEHSMNRGRVMPLGILKAEGITFSFGWYDDAFDGLLECNDGRFHVYCNLDRVESPDSPRARFTLAHELGHYFIDEHRNALLSGRVPSHPSFCEYESSLLVEKEADHFASHLLMPDRRFREAVLNEDIGVPAILAACERFGTSLTSTSVNYVRMDLFVSAVLKWKPEGYGWKWISDTMHKMGYRKTIESLQDIPSGSSTAQVLRGDTVPEDGFFGGQTLAWNWFPFTRNSRDGEVVLIEQAISLGRFGTLTFLYPEQEGV